MSGWMFEKAEVVRVKTENLEVSLVFISGVLTQIHANTDWRDIWCFRYGDECVVEEYDDLHDAVVLINAEDIVDEVLNRLEKSCKEGKCEIDFSN